jgi:hypothetical protein
VDSKSALTLAKNPVFYEWSKHIQVRHHFIQGYEIITPKNMK